MGESDVRVTIPGYRDLTRVGAGGFSMVYRAHQEAFDRSVAVKVLTVELVDENAQRRFQRECRASGRLSNHPNIVTVLDSGFTDDGRPFITTEFMSHGSLADRLDEDGPYPLDEVLDIGVKMCSALAAVHAAGILHRDIKPQNILTSDYGEPALADFGISAITVGPDASIGTSSITPLHVAPEVLEGQPTSTASDVYALGSTLYMLLAGRAPFQQSDDDALLPLMRRVVMDPVPDIDLPTVGPATMDLLRYTMEKQPFARYQTAVALGEAIQGLQAHLGLPVTPMRKPGRTTGANTGGAGVDPAAVISGDFPAATVNPGLVPPPPTAGAPTEPAGGAGAPITPAAPAVVVGAATIAPGGPGISGPFAAAPPPKGGGGKTPLLVGLAILVALVLLGGGLLAVTKRDGGSSTGAVAPVPVGGVGGKPAPPDPGAPTGPGDPGGPTSTTPTETPGLRFDIDGGSLDEATPTDGGTLKVGIDTDGNGWNPSQVRFYGGMRLVGDAIYDPLTVLMNDGPKPYLAKAVTPNATFDQWTIELPSGVTFHDGSAFDAAAVKDNFDTRLANDLNGALLAPVESVTVAGANVVVKTRAPWPAFPVALAGQSGLMAAPATLHGGEGTNPIGTGPFKFASYEVGKSFKATKNPNYRIAGRPYLDGIDFSIVLDSATRRQGLESGDLDLIQISDPGAVTELLSTHSVLVAKEALAVSVVFNTADAQMKDVRLRKALTSALDNEAMIKAVFGGNAYGANSVLPADSPWWRADTNRVYFDLPTAKEILAEYVADHPGKVAVRLTVNQSSSQQAAARELSTLWGALGVETEIATPESPLEELVNGTFQVALWTYDVPTDPDELFVWFHTDPKAGDFTYNLTRLADSNIDKSFDKGRRSAQLTERQAAYGAVDQGLIDVAPAIFYAYLPSALAGSTRLSGWKKETQGGVGRGGTPWATDMGFKK